jgi:hypothetical protein
MAIAQTGIAGKRATERGGGYERTPGLAICSDDWNDVACARVSFEGASSHSQKTFLSEEAKP